MATKNTYRILIWVIVILVATNLSMGLSFWFHKHQDNSLAEKATEEQVQMPSEQRTRFFRDQLNLSIDQVDAFRTLNRKYNQNARQISNKLERLRVEMVEELDKNDPSQELLDSIATEIGELHKELKKETINYYLGMKSECDSAQQEKLKEIFLTVSKTKEDVSLPGRGRGFGRRRTE
ncbi:periplasmic heavy metal sensor [Maribellus sediminis]|uniref:periplasmic heavy metal sensor n=1 Tax=Maribellus sediminis TaxID=2696285 RepID=UPI001430ABBB|nr:periplasmic heavy metal sensor [Maribellus sediminis]